ncbi:MAG: NAD(+) synthase [Planctomycetota bacterium]|nr:MAG: NAD(+) synthase [Planctomycetota bacterium]
MSPNSLSASVLEIDCAAEVEKIAATVRNALRTRFRRRGLVIAMSGGIDSSTVAALCVKAVGKDRVFGLHMPERDSSDDTLRLSTMLAEHLQIDSAHEDITPVLEGVGCYRRRNEAVKSVIPQFAPDWKFKIVLPSIMEDDSYRIFSVVAQSPDGRVVKARLSPKAYLAIVAATNFKQRIRKMLEYYHADRLNYAATGTPNRLEYDQGFFVKLGDGAADIKPIAHLYKTQVYALAKHLGLPDEICSRPPTTDTYSMPQSQEEFYFSLPYDKMDLCLYAKNHGLSPDETAPAVNLTARQVQRVYNDIDQKRKTTRYLHLKPLLIENVAEITA